MSFFTHIFEVFQLDFKLLFIVLFLGIILWKDASGFNGGRGAVFQMGGASFFSGGGGGIGFDGEGGSKKNVGQEGCPIGPHYRKPCMYIQLLYTMYVYTVVLYSLTRAILMSPRKDETRVCGYIYIYIYIIYYIHTHMFICLFHIKYQWFVITNELYNGFSALQLGLKFKVWW